MAVTTRQIEYRHDGQPLQGLLAWEENAGSPRPGVLVAHAWGGRGAFEDDKARRLAELGYAALALDLYGPGVRGGSRDENRRLIEPFMHDRALLQGRMLASLEALRRQPEVDGERVAAVGFCFGGLCVLDLARTGETLQGVVSFHGLLGAPGNTAGRRVHAKVLVLHGWQDPMATPAQLVALGEELTATGADWQAHAYGRAMHAFTNPAANDPGFGTVYQADADRRSWQSMRAFLAEVLG